MTTATELKALTMKPGVQPGQSILFVDLTEITNPDQAMQQLQEMGYNPEIRYLEFAVGLHVIAVLKDEMNADEEALTEEWMTLHSLLDPQNTNDIVRLWRGQQTA